ncbi:hypothetical protein AVEN_164266-1 [Araneus ventricosus]|uniref:DUF19 domain-containing protein n=1 Tax=Araneus ventricosus TaxID=182803 RepID=A0A4Y2I2T1_ARAVE|nr:hypothetical protein AVEN_164266-1 [Araneus ventricosus]
MRFNMLVALQVLLVATLAFAEEEMSMAEVQKIMCDEDNTEISDAMLACLGEMDLSSFMETAKECYPGMEGTSPDELMEYQCSQSPEDLENGDKCAMEKLEEAGKDEEMEEMTNQMEVFI